MKGIVFDIQRFCTKDGPGIRTTVFLKGCPLRCLWCHNPESQNSFIESIKKSDGNSTEICGKQYTPDEVLSIVLKDKLYYKNSGGGLTLSGGEPFFQPDFAMSIIKKASEQNIHITIETCGLASEEIFRQSAKWVDLYLFDFKESDSLLHNKYTGVDNKKIIENLALLNRLGKEIILRCPIIPGFNDRKEHFKKIAELAEKNIHIQKVQLEPYHSFGMDKYRRLGREYLLGDVAVPDLKHTDIWLKEIQQYTNKKVEVL